MLWIDERVKELTLTRTLEDKSRINTFQGRPSGLLLRAAGINLFCTHHTTVILTLAAFLMSFYVGNFKSFKLLLCLLLC